MPFRTVSLEPELLIFHYFLSDEEDENDQLLFLTITPEFDEVDEVAVPTNNSLSDMPVIIFFKQSNFW